MACSGCAKRRAAAEPRATMLRQETEFFEVVSADGVRQGKYATVEEARANRGSGTVRRRVDYVDIPASFSVRLDGDEISRHASARDAAAAAKATAGSSVHMVPRDS